MGVLEVYGRQPGNYGPDHASLLAAFAYGARAVLAKARNYEKIQRLLAEARQGEERLQAQNEELAAQEEEITAQNEEIRAQHEELAKLYDNSREQEARMRAIIQSTSDAIMVVDSDQRIVAANPALEALTGRSFENMVGSPCKYLLSARSERDEAVCDSCCPFRHSEWSAPSNVDATLKTPDGRTIWVNIAYSTIYGSGGRPTAVVHAIRDITARRQLEQQKDEFLSLAAHDLRTPLTAIRGFAQLLLRRWTRAERSEDEIRSLEIIDEQVRRMTTIINTLLDLTRIQMGRLDLQSDATDLQAVAAQIVAQVRVSASAHNVVLESDSGGLVGHWDRGCVERVLSNLIDNAIKYSPKDSTITVTVGRHGQEAVVSVRDEGIGISEHDLPNLFQRYFRTAAAREGASGLGLGLYISKNLIQAHGGSMFVESVPGKGSTFTFALPLEA